MAHAGMSHHGWEEVWRRGAVGYTQTPHLSCWWKEVSSPGGCFCSSLISLYQQLCICHLQRGFSKPAQLQRPVNGKRAAFKPNCSQPYGINSDALTHLGPDFPEVAVTFTQSLNVRSFLSKSRCNRAISVTSTMLLHFSKLQLLAA